MQTTISILFTLAFLATEGECLTQALRVLPINALRSAVTLRTHRSNIAPRASLPEGFKNPHNIREFTDTETISSFNSKWSEVNRRYSGVQAFDAVEVSFQKSRFC